MSKPPGAGSIDLLTTASEALRGQSAAEAPEANAADDNSKEVNADDLVDWESNAVLIVQVQDRVAAAEDTSPEHHMLFAPLTIAALEQLASKHFHVLGLWLCVSGADGPGSFFSDRIQRVVTSTISIRAGRPVVVLHGQAGGSYGIGDHGATVIEPDFTHWQGPGEYKHPSGMPT